MTNKTIKDIADSLSLEIEYKSYANFINVPFIGDLAICYTTIDDNGNPTLECDPKKFPSSCNKKYILDSIEAGCSDLGIIRKINWQNFQDKTFVVADIETTGFSPDKGGRIIEIGAVKIDEQGNIIDTFQSYVNPSLKIPTKITALTGITNEMVANAPKSGEVLRDFYKFFRGSTMVFHNAPFDWDRFIVPFLERLGIKIPSNYPCLDTKEISKFCFPEEKKHDLEALCSRLDIEIKDHHSAFADVQMTAKAFIAMRNQCKQKYEHLPYTEWNMPKNRTDLNFKILSVKYWGKTKVRSGEHTQWRYYVNFMCNGSFGRGFYNVLENEWYIQDCKVSFDAKELKNPVFEFLKINSYEELKLQLN